MSHAVRGDPLADPGDRHVGAGAVRSVVVRHLDRGGVELPDPPPWAERRSGDRSVLLDENVEAAGHEYFDVGAFDMSHDHTLAAWSFDTEGDERYTLHVRDLATGVDLADEVAEISNAGVGVVA